MKFRIVKDGNLLLFENKDSFSRQEILDRFFKNSELTKLIELSLKELEENYSSYVNYLCINYTFYELIALKSIECIHHISGINRKVFPQLRKGQEIWNVASKMYGPEVEKIRGSDKDCFYLDSNIQAFEQFLSKEIEQFQGE